jgi:hypothetical protein
MSTAWQGDDPSGAAAAAAQPVSSYSGLGQEEIDLETSKKAGSNDLVPALVPAPSPENSLWRWIKLSLWLWIQLSLKRWVQFSLKLCTLLQLWIQHSFQHCSHLSTQLWISFQPWWMLLWTELDQVLAPAMHRAPARSQAMKRLLPFTPFILGCFTLLAAIMGAWQSDGTSDVAHPLATPHSIPSGAADFPRMQSWGGSVPVAAHEYPDLARMNVDSPSAGTNELVHPAEIPLSNPSGNREFPRMHSWGGSVPVAAHEYPDLARMNVDSRSAGANEAAHPAEIPLSNPSGAADFPRVYSWCSPVPIAVHEYPELESMHDECQSAGALPLEIPLLNPSGNREFPRLYVWDATVPVAAREDPELESTHDDGPSTDTSKGALPLEIPLSSPRGTPDFPHVHNWDNTMPVAPHECPELASLHVDCPRIESSGLISDVPRTAPYVSDGDDVTTFMTPSLAPISSAQNSAPAAGEPRNRVVLDATQTESEPHLAPSAASKTSSAGNVANGSALAPPLADPPVRLSLVNTQTLSEPPLAPPAASNDPSTGNMANGSPPHSHNPTGPVPVAKPQLAKDMGDESGGGALAKEPGTESGGLGKTASNSTTKSDGGPAPPAHSFTRAPYITPDLVTQGVCLLVVTIVGGEIFRRLYRRSTLHSPVIVTGCRGALKFTWKKWARFDIERDQIVLFSADEYEVEVARVRRMVLILVRLPSMQKLALAYDRFEFVNGLVASYLEQSPIKATKGKAHKPSGRPKWNAETWVDGKKHYFGTYDIEVAAVQATCIGLSRLGRGLPKAHRKPEVIKPIADGIWNQA